MPAPERSRAPNRAAGEVRTSADPHRPPLVPTKPSHHLNNSAALQNAALRREQVKKAYSANDRSTARTKAQLVQLRAEKREGSWQQLNEDLMLDDASSIGSWGSLCDATCHSAQVAAHSGEVQKRIPGPVASKRLTRAPSFPSGTNADDLLHRQNTRSQHSIQHLAKQPPLRNVRNRGNVTSVPSSARKQQRRTSVAMEYPRRAASLPTPCPDHEATLALTSPARGTRMPHMPKRTKAKARTAQIPGAPASARASSKRPAVSKGSAQAPPKKPSATKRVRGVGKDATTKRQCSDKGAQRDSSMALSGVAAQQPVSIAPCPEPQPGTSKQYLPWKKNLDEARLMLLQNPEFGLVQDSEPLLQALECQNDEYRVPHHTESVSVPVGRDHEKSLGMLQQPINIPTSQQEICMVADSCAEYSLAHPPLVQNEHSAHPGLMSQPNILHSHLQLSDTSVDASMYQGPALVSKAQALVESGCTEQQQHVRYSDHEQMPYCPEDESRGKMCKGLAAAIQAVQMPGTAKQLEVRKAQGAVTERSCSEELDAVMKGLNGLPSKSMSAQRAYSAKCLAVQQTGPQTPGPLWDEALMRARRMQQSQETMEVSARTCTTNPVTSPQRETMNGPGDEKGPNVVEMWLQSIQFNPVFATDVAPSDSNESVLSPSSAERRDAATFDVLHSGMFENSGQSDNSVGSAGSASHKSVYGMYEVIKGFSASSPAQVPSKGDKSCHQRNISHAGMQTTPSLLQESSQSIAAGLAARWPALTFPNHSLPAAILPDTTFLKQHDNDDGCTIEHLNSIGSIKVLHDSDEIPMNDRKEDISAAFLEEVAKIEHVKRIVYQQQAADESCENVNATQMGATNDDHMKDWSMGNLPQDSHSDDGEHLIESIHSLCSFSGRMSHQNEGSDSARVPTELPTEHDLDASSQPRDAKKSLSEDVSSAVQQFEEHEVQQCTRDTVVWAGAVRIPSESGAQSNGVDDIPSPQHLTEAASLSHAEECLEADAHDVENEDDTMFGDAPAVAEQSPPSEVHEAAVHAAIDVQPDASGPFTLNTAATTQLETSADPPICGVSESLDEGDINPRSSAAFSAITVSTISSDGDSDNDDHQVSARSVFGSTVQLDIRYGVAVAADEDKHEEAFFLHTAISADSPQSIPTVHQMSPEMAQDWDSTSNAGSPQVTPLEHRSSLCDGVEAETRVVQEQDKPTVGDSPAVAEQSPPSEVPEAAVHTSFDVQLDASGPFILNAVTTPHPEASTDATFCSVSASLCEGDINPRSSAAISAITVSTISSDDDSDIDEHQVSARSVFGSTVQLDIRYGVAIAADEGAHVEEVPFQNTKFSADSPKNSVHQMPPETVEDSDSDDRVDSQPASEIHPESIHDVSAKGGSCPSEINSISDGSPTSETAVDSPQPSSVGEDTALSVSQITDQPLSEHQGADNERSASPRGDSTGNEEHVVMTNVDLTTDFEKDTDTYESSASEIRSSPTERESSTSAREIVDITSDVDLKDSEVATSGSVSCMPPSTSGANGDSACAPTIVKSSEASQVSDESDTCCPAQLEDPSLYSYDHSYYDTESSRSDSISFVHSQGHDNMEEPQASPVEVPTIAANEDAVAPFPTGSQETPASSGESLMAGAQDALTQSRTLSLDDDASIGSHGGIMPCSHRARDTDASATLHELSKACDAVSSQGEEIGTWNCLDGNSIGGDSVEDDLDIGDYLLPTQENEMDEEDLDLGEYLLPMQMQQVQLINFEERREQAAVVAEYVKKYCSRLLDMFLSQRPETIFQQALTDETYTKLDAESQFQQGGVRLINRAAFDTINCALTNTYSISNRVQKTDTLLWKLPPRPKKLLDDSLLKAHTLGSVVDGCLYQHEAVGLHLGLASRNHSRHCNTIKSSEETDPEAVWYSEKVTSVHNADLQQTQKKLASHTAAHFLEHSSLLLRCVAETIEEQLVREVVDQVLDMDRRLHIRESYPAQLAHSPESNGTAPPEEQQSAHDDDSANGEEAGIPLTRSHWTEQRCDVVQRSEIICDTGSSTLGTQSPSHDTVVNLMNIDPQDLGGAANWEMEQSTGQVDVEASQGAGQSSLHQDDIGGDCVLAMDASSDSTLPVEALEEESIYSRNGYERRREYAMHFCALALDSFIEDMPEGLQQGNPMFNTQVLHQSYYAPLLIESSRFVEVAALRSFQNRIALQCMDLIIIEWQYVQALDQSAQELGLQNTGVNALHIQMLERMLLDVYCKLNRAQHGNDMRYMPHPPHRRLPSKQRLKEDLLKQVSCMLNPPWEPPSREDGGDVALELHRNHMTKHLSSSLESCSLHSRATAISDSSHLLILVANDIFDMMVMDTAKVISDVDCVAEEQQ